MSVFKSYHFGIETAKQVDNITVSMLALNRTILELKLSNQAIMTHERATLNRTILELKSSLI